MNLIAKALLETKAVHIEPKPDNFFTWTSGKRSPIYCDNRKLISHHEYRTMITNAFISEIKSNFSDVELIAGTATAGIPWAAWIAQTLALPMIYIRSKPKGHGLQSAIEGSITKNQKTIIIEDLISTGKSALQAYDHCQRAELNTLGVMSIFTYGFQEGIDKFSKENIQTLSLSNLESLLQYAKESKLLSAEECDLVLLWKNDF